MLVVALQMLYPERSTSLKDGSEEIEVFLLAFPKLHQLPFLIAPSHEPWTTNRENIE